jgi:hypothetical protein
MNPADDNHPEIIAEANLLDLYPKFRSKAEERWYFASHIYLYDLFPVPSLRIFYEPVTFNIPGGKYTPDFMHIQADRQIVFVEVKGSKKQKNYRDARSKLRAAAAIHPYFTFVEALVSGDGFECEIIKSG